MDQIHEYVTYRVEDVINPYSILVSPSPRETFLATRHVLGGGGETEDEGREPWTSSRRDTQSSSAARRRNSNGLNREVAVGEGGEGAARDQNDPLEPNPTTPLLSIL